MKSLKASSSKTLAQLTRNDGEHISDVDAKREIVKLLDVLVSKGAEAAIKYIEGEGKWLVTVDEGSLNVAQGDGEADATISTTGETFDKIVANELNPTTAYMTGKLKIKGDMGAAMKLQKLF